MCANLILKRYKLNSSSDIPSKTSIPTYLPISIAETTRNTYAGPMQYLHWNAPVTATKPQTDYWTCNSAKVSPAVSVAVRHSSIPLTITKLIFFSVCPTQGRTQGEGPGARALPLGPKKQLSVILPLLRDFRLCNTCSKALCYVEEPRKPVAC